MVVAVNVGAMSVLTCKKEKYELQGLKKVTKKVVKEAGMFPKDLMPLGFVGPCIFTHSNESTN